MTSELPVRYNASIRSACVPFVRIVNSSRLFIATFGALPSRIRGVCGVMETAWNVEFFVPCSFSLHSSQVPFTAR